MKPYDARLPGLKGLNQILRPQGVYIHRYTRGWRLFCTNGDPNVRGKNRAWLPFRSPEAAINHLSRLPQYEIPALWQEVARRAEGLRPRRSPGVESMPLWPVRERVRPPEAPPLEGPAPTPGNGGMLLNDVTGALLVGLIAMLCLGGVAYLSFVVFDSCR